MRVSDRDDLTTLVSVKELELEIFIRNGVSRTNSDLLTLSHVTCRFLLSPQELGTQFRYHTSWKFVCLSFPSIEVA